MLSILIILFICLIMATIMELVSNFKIVVFTAFTLIIIIVICFAGTMIASNKISAFSKGTLPNKYYEIYLENIEYTVIKIDRDENEINFIVLENENGTMNIEFKRSYAYIIPDDLKVGERIYYSRYTINDTLSFFFFTTCGTTMITRTPVNH